MSAQQRRSARLGFRARILRRAALTAVRQFLVSFKVIKPAFERPWIVTVPAADFPIRILWGLPIEGLEPRVLMSSVSWVNPSGGSWNTASNWSTGVVPGASDDVTINDGTGTITFSSVTASVHSISSANPFSITSGTLTVSTTLEVDNTFTLNGGTIAGATIEAGSGGQGVTVGASTNSYLDGDVVNANIDMTGIGAFLRIKDGLSLSGTATLGGTYDSSTGNYPTLLLQNTQTISGGTVVLPNSGNANVDVEGGATATLGSGVTIQGGDGNVGNTFSSATAHTLVNQGTISDSVSGDRLYINNSNLTFTNQGTVKATSGGGVTLAAGADSNTGTFSADGANSNLALGATWSAGSVGTLSSTNSASISFTGTFNNSASTIALGNTNGSYKIDGGTIAGGTVSIPSGVSLIATTNTNNRLDGVTVSGNLDLTAAGAFLRIKDGLALSGVATLGNTYNGGTGNYPTLLLENTETVSSGTILMPSSGTANVDVEGGTTVTLGSGVTIHGGDGGIGNTYSSATAHTLINQGTISDDVSGQRISFTNTNLTFTNQSVAKAISGGALTIAAGSASANTGTFSADGANSNVTLGATWGAGSLGTLSSTNSASITFAGTFNNSGSTITLGTTSGSWSINGGTITGGTLSIAVGGTLAATSNSNNRLDGVTVSGNIDMTAAGAFLNVKDGLALTGTVTLGNTYNSGTGRYPTLRLENTETITSGTFVLPSSGSDNFVCEGGTTVTLGSGVTVQGGVGNFGNYYFTASAHTLINQGTISDNVAAQTLNISDTYLTLQNQGTIQAVSGGKVAFGSSGTFSSTGSLIANGSGSALSLGGTWTGNLSSLNAISSGAITLPGTFNLTGQTINLTGTSGSYTLSGGTIAGATLQIATGVSLAANTNSNNRLDGATINGNIDMTAAGAFLRIKDGLSLTGTLTMGGTYNGGTGNYPTVLMENSETVTSGTFVLPSSGNARLDCEGGTTVTFGSGVTIHGGPSSVGSYYSSATAHTIINQGTISADVSGQTISVSDGHLTLNNQGTIQAVGGATIALGSTSADAFSSAGTLSATGTGSSITLKGSWTGDLSNVSASSGGSISFAGSFSDPSGSYTFGSTTGSYILNGATITGSTLNIPAGLQMTIAYNTNNVLDGVTVNGNLDMTAGSAFLCVKDGLTLNGTLTLGGATNGANGAPLPTVDFTNTETMSAGTITFPASGSANVDVQNGVTLTLGSGVLIQGGIGTIGASYGTATSHALINQGRITASGIGHSIAINDSTLTFTNQGTMTAASGASLSLSSGGTSTNTGTLGVSDSTSSATLGGSWTMGGVGQLENAGGTLTLTGSLNNTGATQTLAGNLGLSGSITGGTLDFASGWALTPGPQGTNLVDGVTVDGAINLTAAGAFLGVKDGLTLNGTATVGGSSLSYSPYNYPLIDLQNTETLNGNATILLTGATGGLDLENGATATLASSVLVHGSGVIGESYSSSSGCTLVNDGTITSDVASASITITGTNLTVDNNGVIQQQGSGNQLSISNNVSSFTNQGTVQATGGGTLNVTPASFTNLGILSDVGASTLNDAGNQISVSGLGVDGVEGAISWTGLPSSGNYQIQSSTDGSNFQTYTDTPSASSASLIGNLEPDTGYTLRAELDNANGSKILCTSSPVTTLNTPDQSGWYQIASVTQNGVPLTSYTASSGNYFNYNWTLNTNWVQAGSVEGALVSVFNGLVPLSAGIPVQNSDGNYYLTHRTDPGGIDDGPIDVWGWTGFTADWDADSLDTVYKIQIKSRTAPPDPSDVASSEDPNALGGDPASVGQSADPVRYFDGSIIYNTTDLTSNGFGQPFGQTRSWTNLDQYSNGHNGTGVVDDNLPFLVQVQGNTSLVVVNSASDQRSFDYNGSAYVPQGLVPDTLVHNSGEFVYTDTLGQQYHFYDFSSSYPVEQRGQFKSLTDAAGNVTYAYSLNTDGSIAEIRRKDSSGTDQESWLYTNLGSGDANAGLLANVQMRVPDGTGGWSVVRQVSYQYYDGTTSNGNKGDLELATIQDASGNAIDSEYYRYYVAGEANGYAHALKYVFDAASYARLAAAFSDPFTATDIQVAPYATHYFQYDAYRRVTRHTVQGAGGYNTGGLGTYLYQYFTSTNAAGTNSWQYKTIETLPDGNKNIVYCNDLGEVMLKVFSDINDPANSALSGKQWLTFYKYDNAGRVILTAQPSAVTGYDETKPDLLNNQSGNYQYLSDNSGLIQLTDYYASTSSGINDTTAGGVAGYMEDQQIEQGELGTPILLNSQQYYAHANGAIVTYPQASQTRYRNTDGTGSETFTYSYTWYSSSSQPQSMTTSAPVISAVENGPGTADVTSLFYDPYGRVIWSKDADGHVNYTGYDLNTGAVVQTIVDVDYSQLSSALQLSFNQTGWTEPTGGLHLQTTTQVDALGRPTKITDPNGNVTYIVYNDVAHEVRTYAGWNSAMGMPTGPTLVVREDRAGSYTETLTMSAAPHLTGGVPDGTEAISDVQSLQRSYTNSANQLIESDAYFDLNGLSYATTPYLGEPTINYYATDYAYDVNANRSRVEDAVGTITDTLFDALGRPEAVYVGTNDATTNGYLWSPANAAPISNMVQVSADQYDNNGVGDGNLTQLTQFVDSSSSDNRVSVNDFDWRDRLVSSKSGVQGTEDSGTNRPLVVNTLDNLGEVVTQSTYDGDGVAMTDSNGDGVPDALSSGDLRAQISNSYDDQGRVYQSSVAVIDQATGVVTANLVTNTWYDYRGNVIKVQAPSGLVTKNVYDGADRLTATYSTDGGGDSTWADAGTLTGDVVWQQVENVYDSDGNVVESITKLRDGDDSASATGALGDSTTSPQARVTYIANYFDAANRLIATLNVGTNGGAAFTPPLTGALVRDDTHLLTQYSYSAGGFQDTVIDPRGIVTKSFFDALGRATSIIADYTDGTPTNSSNQTTSYTYDGLGRVLTKTLVQPTGTPSETTKYIYGATGNINSNDLLAATEQPDPVTGNPSSSFEETYSYDRLGDVISKGEPNGSTVAFVFDVLGRLASQTVETTDGSGDPVTQYTYDTLGNLASETDARNNITTYDYDSLGRKLKQVLPDPGDLSGHPTNIWSYDAAGNVISMIDPLGNTTTYSFDLLNRRTQEVLPDPDGSTGPLSSPIDTYQYNVGGDENTTTDALGNATGANPALHTTESVFDQFGRVAETIQPSPDGISAQPTTSYSYDRDGNLVSTTNAVNDTTSYAYDNLNRKISETDPDPDGTGPLTAPVTYFAYDAVGNLIAVTDPRNNVTNYQYDAQNRKTAMIQPSPDGVAAQPTTYYAYDVSGNLISVTDPLSHVTSYGFNQLNEKISETDPDPDGSGPLAAPVTTWQYDLNGNVTGVTDPLLQTTSYTFDNLNRQTSEIQPSPDGVAARPTTSYTYDADNNLKTQTDPDNNTTTYLYDNLNRLTSVSDQHGYAELKSYDANGNLFSTTDRNGQVTDFTFDNLNRQVSEQWLNSSSSVIRTTTWTYDAIGRLTSVSDPDSSVTYAYDHLNRPTTITISYTGLSTAVVLSQSFDAAGNRTALTSSLGGTADLANSYLYDALNRLTQAQQSSNGGNSVASKQANFAYNANGQVTTLNRYSDLTGTNLVAASTYGYDNDNRLTSLDHALGSSGSTTLDYTLGYDAASQITSLTTPDGSSTLGYDHDGQLLSASLTSESYSYDANGNRTSGSASTNADNQLASDANDSYTYDKNGNLTGAVRNDGTGSTLYAWDYRNRLTDVTFKDGSGAVTGTIHYTYADNNNRISQTVKNASGTVTLQEFYVYDGSNLVLVLDGSGNVKNRYFNGPNENQVLAEETNIVSSGAGNTHWALTDHEGSVRDVIDNSGSVLDHIQYDSFGNILSQSNSADAMRLAYTGQQYDSQTGLYYDHARYYDPSTGRFLSTDPAGFTAGDENLYRYVGNSPPDRTDPTGLCAEEAGYALSGDFTGEQDPSYDSSGGDFGLTFKNPFSSNNDGAADLPLQDGLTTNQQVAAALDQAISDGQQLDKDLTLDEKILQVEQSILQSIIVENNGYIRLVNDLVKAELSTVVVTGSAATGGVFGEAVGGYAGGVSGGGFAGFLNSAGQSLVDQSISDRPIDWGTVTSEGVKGGIVGAGIGAFLSEFVPIAKSGWNWLSSGASAAPDVVPVPAAEPPSGPRITTDEGAPDTPEPATPDAASPTSRRAFAQDYYRAAGWTDERIANHLAGIDFNSPVDVLPLVEGQEVVQYQVPGKSTGNYFAPLGTPPEALGINPEGRVANVYKVIKDVTVLRSTAASTASNANLPPSVRGGGGGVQYFASDTSSFALKQ